MPYLPGLYNKLTGNENCDETAGVLVVVVVVVVVVLDSGTKLNLYFFPFKTISFADGSGVVSLSCMKAGIFFSITSFFTSSMTFFTISGGAAVGVFGSDAFSALFSELMSRSLATSATC